ncbi:MAG: glycerol-3-phosphate 1-O-acyltransferase PlsY [Candidatus Brocadiia bacterium]
MSAWLYLLPVAAYLYGAVPFGFLAARWLRGVDIRETGSGNIGATNAARVLGFRFFPLIFLLDLSKGLVPTLAAMLLAPQAGYDPHPLAVGTGLAAILGHVFPVYLGFKGGKAVAASTGVFAVLAPWQVLIAAGVWGAVFGAFRYVSLASVSAAAALPLAVWLLEPDPLGKGVFLTAMATLGGAFVIYLHRTNIRRLLAGTEHRIGR